MGNCVVLALGIQLFVIPWAPGFVRPPRSTEESDMTKTLESPGTPRGGRATVDRSITLVLVRLAMKDRVVQMSCHVDGGDALATCGNRESSHRLG